MLHAFNKYSQLDCCVLNIFIIFEKKNNKMLKHFFTKSWMHRKLYFRALLSYCTFIITNNVLLSDLNVFYKNNTVGVVLYGDLFSFYFQNVSVK